MQILDALRRRLAGGAPTPSGALSRPFRSAAASGELEVVEGPPLPILRLSGWFDGDRLPACELELGDRRYSPDAVYRTYRPGTLPVGGAAHPMSGFEIEFVDLPRPSGAVARLHVGEATLELLPGEIAGLSTAQPVYEALLETEKVLHREQIYGHGLPTDVHPEIRAVAGLCRGRTLDFGCGNGDVVLRLRGRGIDAHGIELATERIEANLKEKARPYVQLYPGGFPLPYPDKSFDTVFCSEVLEHIPDYRTAIREIARIATDRAIFTVPDMTSIPWSHPTGTVPWHLLESTHVNFFNHHSLTAAVAAYFEVDRLFRLCPNRVNQVKIPGNLGALCLRRSDEG